MGEVTLLLDGRPVTLTVTHDGEESVVLTGGHKHRIHLSPLEPGVLLLTVAGRTVLVHVAGQNGRWALHVDGQTLEYEVGQEGSRRRAETGQESEALTAPMPGAVTQVLVREGDAVSPGQPLVIVEAMKMEHVVRAPRAGTIKALRVRPGEQVESGAIVAEIGSPRPPAGGEKK